MNGHAEPPTNAFDVIILGAGISGINAAYRVQTSLPNKSYAILEARDNLGGTWDLFKYPGIRSDSDLHTFGFGFNPWQKSNPIATGASIVEYLKETTERFGIDKKIQYQHKVISANWSSDAQHWRLEVEDGNGARKYFYANFVILGTGYYDYKKPLEAKIPGIKNFEGLVVHPQFWPQDLAYEGKKIIVIGSGATAITLMPALAPKAAKVTMLQRSPSYVFSLPQPKPGHPLWHERLFPKWISLLILRWRYIIVPYFTYKFCRAFPNVASKYLINASKKQLPPDFPMDPHFKPTYNPWDQRLCLCPDGDFFQCFHEGRANIVTAHIDTVTADGIVLKNGEKLEADIIITATGLRMQVGGDIEFTVDNNRIAFRDKFLWHYSLLEDVPNLSFIIGYTNAPWTLGSDATCRLLVRLMKFMGNKGYTSAKPRVNEKERSTIKVCRPFGLSSTYMDEGWKDGVLPKTGDRGPWVRRDNYFRDSWVADWGDLREGLVFEGRGI